MTTFTPPTVTLNHPTDPKLRGEVVFILPSAYTRVAIGRRATELANAGRAKHLPRLSVTDLPYDAYQLCMKLATLEYVIQRAPEGLYGNVKGSPVLMPGALNELEGEEDDGVINMLYDAYSAWRQSFREHRAGHPDRIDPQPDHDPPGPTGPAPGAAAHEGTGDS